VPPLEVLGPETLKLVRIGAAVWPVASFVASAWSGYPAVKDTPSRASLLRASGVGAVLASLPLAAFLLLGFDTSDELVAAGVACFLAQFSWSAWMRGQGTKLPVATDERLLARVAELAQKLGLATPPVRLQQTLSLNVQALVSGLPRPRLIVHDGILHRLSEEDI
jgi:Zn-dependent protease with chaperone function